MVRKTWASGATTTIARSASCHEYTNMATAAPAIRVKLRIQLIAPHSMNRAMASTSAVTRDTNAPRFSAVCSAIESAWMCRNVRTRIP